MTTAKSILATLGVSTADILVPGKGIDLEKWAVVACDQYTSQPEYWARVDSYVGSSPSTLRLTYPEVYLESADKEKRIWNINRTMDYYLRQGLFIDYPDSFFLVNRTTGNKRERWGLLVALDLEKYDYGRESRSLIRATEGTILSRIPPRKEIRKNALLEVPHIMVLIDDRKKSVIEPLVGKRAFLEAVYATDLMEGGGSLEAFRVHREEDISRVADALLNLYTSLDAENPLLFAMGDGNHSLATAKSCWEDMKKNLTRKEQLTHPARYALVELENIHQEGLVFEPIHRLLFGMRKEDFLRELKKHASFVERPVSSLSDLRRLVNEGEEQRFGYIEGGSRSLFTLDNPDASIVAGTLQNTIDALMAEGKASVDYVHGEEVVDEKAKADGTVGLILSDVSKDTFFRTIIRDKALPRKTFSMGEAAEKRYYMEARCII